MQPESSIVPRQISTQKLNGAREMVTITKQRRQIYLVETKRTSNEDLQVVKFV